MLDSPSIYVIIPPPSGRPARENPSVVKWNVCIAAVGAIGGHRKPASGHGGLSKEAPVLNGSPRLVARRTYGVPNRRVEFEIVVKRYSAAGSTEDRESIMVVQVCEIERAERSPEGAKGWSTRFWRLGRGWGRK